MVEIPFTEEKYQEGDMVFCHRISPRPDMVVKELIREGDKLHGKTNFKGLLCYWFSAELVYQEAMFHAKDLKKK